MKKVTMYICEEWFAFAQERAFEDGFLGPVDYLNGLFLVALLTEWDECQNAPARGPATRIPPRDEEPDWFDELEEDEGGGMRLKEEPGDYDEPYPEDEDEPFPEEEEE